MIFFDLYHVGLFVRELDAFMSFNHSGGTFGIVPQLVQETEGNSLSEKHGGTQTQEGKI